MFVCLFCLFGGGKCLFCEKCVIPEKTGECLFIFVLFCLFLCLFGVCFCVCFCFVLVWGQGKLRDSGEDR